MTKDSLQPRETPTLSDISFPSEYSLSDHYSGKVRERYAAPDNLLILATTDRISAFDMVLGTIPYKGQVLNRMSRFWFDETSDIVPNHMIATPDPNVMVCRPGDALPVEVIVRGVMKGISGTSIWPMYERGERNMYGVHFREGYKYGDKLDEPVITPTTKAEKGGHDAPITEREIVESGLVDESIWMQTRNAALELFKKGQEIANNAGFMMIDTKIEFGLDEKGNLMVIDELFTPDSAGFWLTDSDPASPEIYDKEYLRIAFGQMGYKGQEGVIPPPIPFDLKKEVSKRYIEVFERITGEKIEDKGENIEERIITNMSFLTLI